MAGTTSKKTTPKTKTAEKVNVENNETKIIKEEIVMIKEALGMVETRGLVAALFLGLIACFPLLLNIATGGLLNVISFSGSTLLIVVGVILETVREMEAQMTMRHYKGFLD